VKKNKKGKVLKRRSFTLSHCYMVLEKEEKWRTRDMKVPMRAKMEPHLVGDDDDEASSVGVKRSPTPSSVARPNKRPMGVKGRKSGDDDIKKAMEAMVSARKEYTEEKRLEKAMVSAAEERRLALDEKISMVEYARVMAQEKELFLMDTSNLDERQNEYFNLCRDDVLVKKRMMASTFAPLMSGFGGFDGMGGMGGFGSMSGMRGMGVMGGFVVAWEHLREALEATSAWVHHR
jgi:hypothetical protein